MGLPVRDREQARRLADEEEEPRREDRFSKPWLRTDETAEYLGFGGRRRNARRSVYRFIQQKGIRTARRGHTVLVNKADIDAAIGATNARPRR